MTTKSNKGLIVKSNKLIEASYRLTTIEQKLILRLISEIKPTDEYLKIYKLNINEFEKLLGIKNNSIYSQLKKVTRSLTTKPITIIKENELIQVTWLSGVRYLYGQGEIEIEISSFLAPYLLQLKERFTKFYLETIIQLKSSYSIRLYEIFKQYEKLKERIISIQEMRGFLKLENQEYEKYNDFKRKVILQSQKEINLKTDINFEFEEIKEGRKVTKLKFIITSKNQKNIPTLLEEKNENTNIDSEIENIINQFKKKYNADLNFKLIENLVLEKSINHVKACLEKYDDYVCGDIKNIAGHFYKFVKEGYEKPVNHKANYLFPQLTNFRQREYTEQDFEDFFDKIGEE